MERLIRRLLVILATVSLTRAKTAFYMDLQTDCSFIGVQDVSRDIPMTIYAKGDVDRGSTITACSIDFMGKDSDSKLQLEFNIFQFHTCNAKLFVSGDGTGRATEYGCGNNNIPNTYFSIGRTLTVSLFLQGSVSREDYNFQLQVISKRESQFPPPSDSMPMSVGLVAGIGVSVFGVLIVIAIVGCCCFRKYRIRGSTRSPYLYDPESKMKLEESNSHVSVGVTNESVKAGAFNENSHGTPSSRKKLLAPSESSDEKSDGSQQNRQKHLRNNRDQSVPPSSQPGPPALENYNTSPKSGTLLDEGKTGRVNERGVDVDTKPPNPMLSALHQNAKFKNTFKETEADAEARAKRISSSSSFEQFGRAPSPPSSDDEKYSKAVEVPKSTKGKKGKKQKNKKAVSGSVSSDELVQIEENRQKALRSNGDANERSEDSVSSTEVISNNRKANTTHSLRPDRKGAEGKKNQTNGQTPRDRLVSNDSGLNDSFDKMGSARFSKRSQKSPRPQRLGGKTTGFSHRRNRSTDQFDSRPTTPNSFMGSMEDLESLPPLQRASSKNSLYASRSSLYDRRGRRRRGSYGESVASYARDDMEIMRSSRNYEDFSDEDDDFDGYEKPLSRRDRERMYRSETDIGKRVKEISTQTLRETATQTGVEDSVIFQKKRLVKKRRRSRSMSSAGTQTKDKKKTKAKTTDQADSGVEGKPLKVKKSKSISEIDSAGQEKSKPKPKPRKSASAATHLDENNPAKSASKENLTEPAFPQGQAPQSAEGAPPVGYPVQYYPGSGGFPYPPPYPGQPGPNYMYQGPPQPGMPGGPQGYPPNMYQPPGANNSNGPMPQSYGAAATRKPRKSNWEMLCELTEGEYRNMDDVTETGSVASSVFTTNLPSAGYGAQPINQPGYYPAMHPGYNQNSYPGSQPHTPRQYTPPQELEPQPQRVPVVSESGREQPINKQASWEALTEVTGANGRLPKAQNNRTESIV